MLFSNLSFIFIFLPVVVLIYFFVPQKQKNVVFLLASLVFYAWGEPVYVILLLLSAVFNYFCGRDLQEKQDSPVRKKRSLIFAIVINLLILGFFKYYVLFMESINMVSPVELPYRELAVPVGLSIYILRALSYLIDVYRNEAEAQDKFIHLALYLSMFPQMIAGPIDRYINMEKQLEMRTVSLQRFGSGAVLFVCGLAKKVILADSAGILQEQITGLQIGTFSVATAWIGCVAFAFRFYFELSGFADMAVGIGRMFGFDLQRNFYYPYVSRSVTEFWRRWNVSLASWFRVYLYEPLGGSQGEMSGQMWRILLVGMLTGLWYGAEWRFLWWGIYCGIFLILERFVWGKRLAQLPKVVQHLYAIMVIFIGWVFFFTPDLGAALDYIGVMFGMGASALADTQVLYFVLSHWLLLVLCILGTSSRGSEVIRTLLEAPQSMRGKVIVACVVYMAIFLIGLAFLVTKYAIK